MTMLRNRFKLIFSDFVLSFMWVWSGALAKVLVRKVVVQAHDPIGEFVYGAISILNTFLFVLLGNATHGGSYNPLTVLSSAASGNITDFLLVLGARIPAQVLGSIYGVRLILDTFPEIGYGPLLKVDIFSGALTEGCLTFAIVIVSLGLSWNIPGSFFRKTWISSVSKLTLHILGSDLTGGCMNPASVMGWAYARGDHISMEHILVYWLAPVTATLLAVWTFRWVVKPLVEGKDKKAKSE